MTSPHPIAEQDSLERLIASLRAWKMCGEAADTLSQMRNALERAGRALEIYGDSEEVEAVLVAIGKANK